MVKRRDDVSNSDQIEFSDSYDAQRTANDILCSRVARLIDGLVLSHSFILTDAMTSLECYVE